MIKFIPCPVQKTVKLRAADADTSLAAFDALVLTDPRSWDHKVRSVIRLLAGKAQVQLSTRRDDVEISSTELRRTLGQRVYLSHWTRLITSVRQGHASFEANRGGAWVEGRLSSYDALGYLMRLMGWARSQSRAIYLAITELIREIIQAPWFLAFLFKRFTWLRADVTTIKRSTTEAELKIRHVRCPRPCLREKLELDKPARREVHPPGVLTGRSLSRSSASSPTP